MHFKLSARELGILEDREAILSRLRDSQDKRTKKTLKPPILVVPEDKSRLICVIERDDSFEKLFKVDDDGDEGGGGGGESAVRRRQLQRQPEEEEQGESRKAYAGSPADRLLYHARRTGHFLRQRADQLRRASSPFYTPTPPSSSSSTSSSNSSSSEASTAASTAAAKHKRRLQDSLALTTTMISSSSSTTTTSLSVVNGLDSWLAFFANPLVQEVEDTLSLKCEVRVLSNYGQLFKMIDAILEADIVDS